MRTGFFAITVGISTAMTLRREKDLTSQVVTISLLTEILTIVISGLIEIA